MDKLAKKIYETIRRDRLFEPGERVVVGVSGGADSVALLLILRELKPILKLRLAVAHFNHRWRGAESDADEKFVAARSRRLRLPFRAGRAAKKPAKNREAVARDDRYRFLCATAADVKASAIAVAHHADDQAETFLINLLRGAGPDGLSGMDPAGLAPGYPSVRLVRPLLGVTRAELRDYLGRAGQDWREDSSNLDPDFLRNRVRAELLPMLVDLNPAVAETLGRTADIMREQAVAMQFLATGWLTHNADQVNQKFGLPLPQLRPWPMGFRLAILREVVCHLAGPAGVTRQRLLDLDRLACSPGCGVMNLPGLNAEKIYDLLELTRASGTRAQVRALPSEAPLSVPGRIEWAGPGDRIITIFARQVLAPPVRNFFRAAAIDPRKITGALRVRRRRPGDDYRPAGMRGRRQLKDVLNELRVPPSERDRWPLIVDDKEIIWVPGMRPATKVAFQEPGPVLVIEIEPALRAAMPGPGKR